MYIVITTNVYDGPIAFMFGFAALLFMDFCVGLKYPEKRQRP